MLTAFYYEEKVSMKTKTVNDSNNHNFSIFVSPVFTFPLAGNIIFYTPNQVEMGKSTLVIIFIMERLPTLAKNKHLSVHFFLQGPRLFCLSIEKVQVQSVRSGHQSGYFRADTINNNINRRSKKFSMRRNLEKFSEKEMKYKK